MNLQGLKEDYILELKKAYQHISSDKVFSAWNKTKNLFESTKRETINRYEELMTKIERIKVDVAAKNRAHAIDIKRLTELRNSKRHELNQAKERQTIRQDITNEIEAEVKLKVDSEDLKQRIEGKRQQIQHVLEKQRQYFEKYHTAITKLEKRRSKIAHEKKVKKMEETRIEALELYDKKCKEEIMLLSKDLELLEKIRGDFLRRKRRYKAPVKKETPQQMLNRHFNILLESNVVNHDHKLLTVDQDGVLLLDETVDAQDKTVPCFIGEYSDTREEEDLCDTESQIVAIQNNINLLLSTGQYQEDDPVIVNMKKKILDLNAQ